MTQNHQEWVRGVEDFKIEHEKMEELKNCTIADFSVTGFPPATASIDWDSIGDPDTSSGIDRKLQVDL